MLLAHVHYEHHRMALFVFRLCVSLTKQELVAHLLNKAKQKQSLNTKNKKLNLDLLDNM